MDVYLRPEPGTRSSINHFGHVGQRCCGEHMTYMARVGVLLPVVSVATKSLQRGPPPYLGRARGRGAWAGATPTATHRAPTPMPLRQLHRLRDRHAANATEELPAGITGRDEGSVAEARPRSTRSTGVHGRSWHALTHTGHHCPTHTGSHWRTLAHTGSHCSLPLAHPACTREGGRRGGPDMCPQASGP
jgi:hypothetical protein